MSEFTLYAGLGKEGWEELHRSNLETESQKRDNFVPGQHDPIVISSLAEVGLRLVSVNGRIETRRVADNQP